MSKYQALWEWIKENASEDITLSFAEIETIAGVPLDYSFLTSKKELAAYGYQVEKISMKNQTVAFRKSS